MCGVSPPRWSIQRRTSNGYMEYTVCVASGLVILRPLEPGPKRREILGGRGRSRIFCHEEPYQERWCRPRHNNHR
jgi:hypothetical protein